MATTLRASSQNSATSGTAITVSRPTGTVEGDVVLVKVHVNGQTTIVDNNGATPFTEDINDYKPNTSSGHTASLFRLTIPAGNPATYSFTSGASGRWSAVAETWMNPNATFYDVTPVTGNATNLDSPPGSSGATSASINTTTSNAIHKIDAFIDASIDDFTGWPSGYTVTQSVDNNQGQTGVYKVIAAAGATGTQNFTHNGSGTAYITFSYAIKDIGGSTSVKDIISGFIPFAR